MADQTATLDKKYVENLPAEVTRATGFTHKFRIPFTEVYNAAQTTQGDTKTITLGTTPAKWVLRSVVADVKTAFTTTGTLTFSVGTSGNVALGIAASTDAKTAALVVGNQGSDPVTLAGSFGITVATLQVRFTTQSATGAISDITAGELVVFMAILDLTAQ